ncbi:hypothetical protein OAK20_02195 [Synechococcus sp. AH-551-P21]|nr:hypothetical protein [Synechococcus sp. AH-551-P21]
MLRWLINPEAKGIGGLVSSFIQRLCQIHLSVEALDGLPANG